MKFNLTYLFNDLFESFIDVSLLFALSILRYLDESKV